MYRNYYDYLEDIERIKYQSDSCELFDKKNIIDVYKKLSSKEIIKVIDVGCGDGYLTFSRFKSLTNIQLMGIDINLEALKIAQNNAPDNFKFCKLNIIEDNFNSEDNFDIAFSANVFHHLKNPLVGMQKVWDKINPKGYFIIRTFNDSSKIFYPHHSALEILFKRYNKVSKSDRFFSNRLNSLINKLSPKPSRVIYDFFTECSVNYSIMRRDKLFEDIFRFRIDNLKNSLSIKELNSIDLFRNRFITDRNYFFSTTHHIVKIEKT